MTQKKRIIILGAGISGLIAAWLIAKEKPEYECLLLEKGERAGGHMETGNEYGVTLEKGPHIFKTSRNQDFLYLIEEVGFSSELIFSSKKAKKRYLWIDGKLQTILSATYKDLFKALLQEWKKPIVYEEETIWEFASRRFGKKIAERLFDPLVLGIYAGDSRKLSMDACFPSFKKLEKENGSLTKALFFSLLKKRSSSLKGLFSFKKGVSSFIEHLEKKIKFPILYGHEVHKIEKKGEKFHVFSKESSFEGDEVILALPAYVSASLIRPLQEEVYTRLLKIPYQSITSVNVLLKGDILKYSGFGYLIPTEEQETLLGVLFDSSIFPEQDAIEHTKLTLMMRGSDFSEEEIRQVVDRCLTKHLGISYSPKEIVWKKMPEAIPQYILGHEDNVSAIRKILPQGVYLIGNYLEGVSVNDAVKVARSCISLVLETSVSIVPKERDMW